MAKTILTIEDDNFLQGLEATKLKKEGYDVLGASNSVEAFKIIEEKKNIDLILLDLLLPEVDGFMILEKITARLPEFLKRFVVAIIEHFFLKNFQYRSIRFKFGEYGGKNINLIFVPSIYCLSSSE